MELKEERKKEEFRFRMQAAIAFPDSAKELLSFSDAAEEQFDVPEIEEYNPSDPGFSDESVETMLQALEEFGFYVEEGEGVE